MKAVFNGTAQADRIFLSVVLNVSADDDSDQKIDVYVAITPENARELIEQLKRAIISVEQTKAKIRGEVP